MCAPLLDHARGLTIRRWVREQRGSPNWTISVKFAGAFVQERGVAPKTEGRRGGFAAPHWRTSVDGCVLAAVRPADRAAVDLPPGSRSMRRRVGKQLNSLGRTLRFVGSLLVGMNLRSLLAFFRWALRLGRHG